jgi:aminopeptidase
MICMDVGNQNKNPGNPQFDRMIEGATNVLQNVLFLKKGEKMLIVMDESKKDIGQAFEEGARVLGASTQKYSLSKHKRPITEIPDELRLLFKNQKVIINTFGSDPKETPFRVKLLYEEILYNARVGHAPGITVDMMKEGPMRVDYTKIVKDADHLMSLFKSVKEVHITAPAGTDLVLDIEDRTFQTDVKINEGEFGNLPAGEIWCAPVENAANGVIVVDGSIGDIGNVTEPLHLGVKAGYLERVECGDKSLVKQIEDLSSVDKMARIIGELGIGLNPGARLTGNLLEDEKAGGTAHIAFGNNIDMVGGRNNSMTHRDYLFNRPTFEATYKDGSKKTIIQKGKVMY